MTAMKENIEARKDLEDGIYNDPVKLLKLIKQHALNYQELRYKMSVISDVFTTFFGTSQRYQECLQYYTRIFKTSYEVLKWQIGGPIQIHKFVKTLNGFKYDPDNKYKLLTNKQLTKQVSDQIESFVYL